MMFPQPLPPDPDIAAPEDVPFAGLIRLHVDATDIARRIFRVRQTIPVAPGPLTLLYPKWLPGFHSPAAAIELLAGLEIRANGAVLPWRRHPVEMHAFHLDIPDACSDIDLQFQFLSPTAEGQGAVCTTPAMTAVRWGAMVLYPAGYFSRRIQVEASLTLPDGWALACALEPREAREGTTAFLTAPLDVLVDSPVLAGRWANRIALDGEDSIRLCLFGDYPQAVTPSEAQLAPCRALVEQADALFQRRPFDHFDFLVAVSDELGGGGVEHHRSCEIVLPSDTFTAWERNAPKRDVFAHEFVHAWNGKGRRGADSWTPSFERPIRNSLMWVYEGLTQYWGEVLAVRAGLWSPQQAKDALARIAALYANRPGGCWRTMSDTTRDPIIASRQPLPWPSWQRSEDYYSEGQLLWLDVDTLIREVTGERKSLDDFARRFFGQHDQAEATSTYDFADVVEGLSALAPLDWAGFLGARLESREVGAPLDGLERGGYRLVYRREPTAFAVQTDDLDGVLNHRFSLGLALALNGTVSEVIWESPAFAAGIVAGAKILAINGDSFDGPGLGRAIDRAEETGGLELALQDGKHVRTVTIHYSGGRRFPHLERAPGLRARLDDILAPLDAGAR